jgi:hypothetical protein
MINVLSLTIQIALVAFLVWGAVLSLKCIARDRTWFSHAGN